MIAGQREIAATTPKHWVRLTRVCNNHCIFCLDKEPQNGTCLPFARIKKDLAEGRRKNINKLILSGGEPTIHPEFLDIVKFSKKSGYKHIQVITNGRMFAYGGFLKEAVATGISEITFSIHGHYENLHDRQTGVRGSFKQAMAGLNNALMTERLIVNVDIVINKINVKHLYDILSFFIKLGVSEFDLLQVIPFGRAWDNKNDVLYDVEGSLAYLKKALRLSKDPNLHIWTNRFPAQYLERCEGLIQHPFKLYDEVRGNRAMFERFFSHGRIMDCFGERCQFCFLESFCRDLAKLKSERVLFSKKSAPCLKSHNEYSKLLRPHKFLLKGNRADMFDFTDFYINSRYFVKSLRCKTCLLDSDCEGVKIDFIRKKGFSLLKPIK